MSTQEQKTLPYWEGFQVRNGSVYGTWENWGAFVDTVDAGGTLYWRHPTLQSSDRTESGGGDWYASQDWEDSLRLARNGWTEHAATIGLHAEQLQYTLLHGLEQGITRLDFEGLSWDLDAVMRGEPECWWATDPVPTMRASTAIVCNCVASCSITPRELIAKGTAVVSLARMLEFVRVPTEVWVVCTIGGGPDQSRSVMSVCLKRASEPFDISLLAYALAHPSAFRRQFFRASEMVPPFGSHKSGGPFGSGYGFVCDLKASEAAEICPPEKLIYVPGQGYNVSIGGPDKWDTPEPGKETEWVLGKLRKCGVVVREEQMV